MPRRQRAEVGGKVRRWSCIKELSFAVGQHPVQEGKGAQQEHPSHWLAAGTYLLRCRSEASISHTGFFALTKKSKNVPPVRQGLVPLPGLLAQADAELLIVLA